MFLRLPQVLPDLLVRGGAHHHHRVSGHHRAHILHWYPNFKVGEETDRDPLDDQLVTKY